MQKDKTYREVIQTMPLKKGFVNLTTGTFPGVEVAKCVVIGTLTVTWADGGTDVISCAVGDYYSFVGATSVAVTTGTFHLS